MIPIGLGRYYHNNNKRSPDFECLNGKLLNLHPTQISANALSTRPTPSVKVW